MACGGDILFEVNDLTVSIGGAELFSGVNLALRCGEVAGLLGPSGCGKSTLLRCLAGLIDPAAGTISLQGKPLADWAMPDYRRQVLMIGQSPVLIDDTVEANLRLPFSYEANSDLAYDPAATAALLERLGVEPERQSQLARSLSLGQQQRVCLVRALLLEPTVILMDEPTSALDVASVVAVETLLAEIVAERTIAAIVVSHDPHQLQRIAHHQFDIGPCAARAV